MEKQKEEKITDEQAAEAMEVIRRYCEEHLECEDCKMDCVTLKQGIAPCFWQPMNLECYEEPIEMYDI